MHSSGTETSRYDICGWDIGDDDFDVSVCLNGVRFTIHVAAHNFIDSPCALQTFYDTLQKLKAGEDDRSEVWDYAEDIVDVYEHDMRKLAPPVLHTGKLTLADLTSRGFHACDHRVIDEEPTPPISAHPSDTMQCKEWELSSTQSQFPIFRPEDVEVPYSDGWRIHDITPQDVYIQAKRCFYKSCWSPYDAIAEVDKYSKLAAANTSENPRRTSQLFGIVVSSHGHARGLLYDWIEVRDAGVLTEVLGPDTPIFLREKWATQVQNTVAELHRLGVTWGDVKPSNVLIDIHDDAIVIDLAGGTTWGWVDTDVADSVEGDLQGLERLVNFILRGEGSTSSEPTSGNTLGIQFS